MNIAHQCFDPYMAHSFSGEVLFGPSTKKQPYPFTNSQNQFWGQPSSHEPPPWSCPNGKPTYQIQQILSYRAFDHAIF